MCLFHRGDSTPIALSLYGKIINSDKTMNVLGVIFDSKLQWVDHIKHALNRSTKALNAIRLIRNFFNQKELLALITLNFYSILYYNSEIWHIPTLKSTLKQKLLSASARALRVSVHHVDYFQSLINLHKMCNRAIPESILKYIN